MYYTDEILHKEQAQAFPKPDAFRHIVRSQIINYYSDRDEPILIDKAMRQKGLTITDDSRCHYMMHPEGIVWESMNALATAFRQKQTEHIHFIQYDDLVEDPEKVLNGLHWFLKLKPYKYDFNNIVAKDREKDSEVYGLPTMHEVRKEVKKISKPYTEVLNAEVINKYITYDFWNQQ